MYKTGIRKTIDCNRLVGVENQQRSGTYSGLFLNALAKKMVNYLVRQSHFEKNKKLNTCVKYIVLPIS